MPRSIPTSLQNQLTVMSCQFQPAVWVWNIVFFLCKQNLKRFSLLFIYTRRNIFQKSYICAAFVFGLTSRRRIEVCDMNIVGAMPSIWYLLLIWFDFYCIGQNAFVLILIWWSLFDFIVAIHELLPHWYLKSFVPFYPYFMFIFLYLYIPLK